MTVSQLARRFAPALIVLLAAVIVVAVMTGCGGTGLTRAAKNAAAANPTASADLQATTVKAIKVIDHCAGVHPTGPDASINLVLTAPVLRHLATKAGRAKFAKCVFPDPAKRAKAEACIKAHVTLAKLVALTKWKLEAKLLAAGEQVLLCVRPNL